VSRRAERRSRPAAPIDHSRSGNSAQKRCPPHFSTALSQPGPSCCSTSQSVCRTSGRNSSTDSHRSAKPNSATSAKLDMASTPPRIGAKGSSSGPCASIKRRSRAYDPSFDGQGGADSPGLLPPKPPLSPWTVASDALRRAEPSDLRRASSACGLEDAFWAAVPASWPIAAASLPLLSARIASLAALPAASAASRERPSSSAARVALRAATSARKPLCAPPEPSGIETGGVPASAVDMPRMPTCTEAPPAASSWTQS